MDLSAKQERTRRAGALRGALLGLAIGDAVGAVGGRLPAEGPLRGTVLTQLVCGGVDGTLRAYADGAYQDPSEQVAGAHRRWAAAQGTMLPLPGDPALREPDWLLGVPAYRELRGSTKDQVAALLGRAGPPEPTGTAEGLFRALPAGLVQPDEMLVDHAWTIAAFAHTDEVATIAMTLAAFLRDLVAGRDFTEEIARFRGCYGDGGEALLVAAHRGAAWDNDPAQLRLLAPDDGAVSVFRGAVYVAVSTHECGPAEHGIEDAIRLAATAPYGAGVAALSGALLGALYGVDALPVAWLSRLDLGWALDRLARDLADAVPGEAVAGGAQADFEPVVLNYVGEPYGDPWAGVTNTDEV